MGKQANIFVIAAPAISGLLEKEIIGLGFKHTQQERLGVHLSGTLEDCMYLNLNLRTANKVLWEVGRFRANNPNQLYAEARKIPWEDEIDLTGYFNIDSYVRNETITLLKSVSVDRIQGLKKIKREFICTGPIRSASYIMIPPGR